MTAGARTDGLGVIRADYQERLKPRFRRGSALYSEVLKREVRPAEGCFAPDRLLIMTLAAAKDAPRDGNGVVDPKRLPKFYRDWSRCAWQELLNGLPEEAECAEVVTTAGEEFKQAVLAGLHEQVTLGREGQDPQRHSLIDWAVMFAKPGGWRQVRSYLIWCECEREGAPPCVAVRVELFSQVRRAGLADLGHRQFVSRCEMYGIGQKERAGGKRVVELTADFLIEVREGAAEDVLTGGR